MSRLISPAASPAQWLEESLAPQDIPSPLGGGFAGAFDAPGGLTGQTQRYSPLSALMLTVNRLVNPPEIVGKTQVEFRQMVDGVAYDTTAQTLLQLLQGGDPSSPSSSTPNGSPGQDGAAAAAPPQRPASLPLSVPEIQVLTPQQLQELALFLLTGAELPWPRPAFQASLKTHLAFAGHARLFGTPAAGGGGRIGGRGAGGSKRNAAEEDETAKVAAAVGAQRPPLEGRNADKVGFRFGA